MFFCCYCYEQSHEFDECRFDVAVNNCVWYLRAENPEDKMHWIEVLQSYKPLSGIGIDTVSLMRHGSIVSLQSNSLMANPSLGVGGLREKIAEMETFRDILSGQLDTLQRYVGQIDGCRVDKYDFVFTTISIYRYFDELDHKNGALCNGLNQIDFKVCKISMVECELIFFKKESYIRRANPSHFEPHHRAFWPT